ncbi:DUF2199 domain-containing protein [Phaeobacter sp. 11ANDIMAR09]|uniref:DUF2199 domain-containing protein n=1 Tax=Phaeobacter sp. 11ANDIMAR09 TaxID=1225647 RepID=UPI0006C86604|nr:DUF2199 domain-containing protein [Phaeobacter sp. 11ANDIMAR09]KPD12516.1 hypothetical protein AN476_09900 [Phaeobacter sp. 11ANDIMAR09]
MLTSSRQCRCCGATFAQLLSLSCDRPDLCPDDLVVQDNSAILAQTGDVLTDDFCRLGDLRFVRAVLAIPLADSGGQEFILGTWANLGVEDFDTYLDLLDMQETESMGSRPAWLANAMPSDNGAPVACMLHMRPEGQYPELQVSEPNHSLATLQHTGAQLEDLFELLHSYGHDLASLVYDS